MEYIKRNCWPRYRKARQCSSRRLSSLSKRLHCCARCESNNRKATDKLPVGGIQRFQRRTAEASNVIVIFRFAKKERSPSMATSASKITKIFKHEIRLILVLVNSWIWRDRSKAVRCGTMIMGQEVSLGHFDNDSLSYCPCTSS